MTMQKPWIMLSIQMLITMMIVMSYHIVHFTRVAHLHTHGEQRLHAVPRRGLVRDCRHAAAEADVAATTEYDIRETGMDKTVKIYYAEDNVAGTMECDVEESIGDTVKIYAATTNYDDKETDIDDNVEKYAERSYAEADVAVATECDVYFRH